MIRVIEEEDCPSQEFTPGIPAGVCWGDGHYKCNDCVLFRADFKADDTLREKLLIGQGFIHIYSMGDGQTVTRIL